MNIVLSIIIWVCCFVLTIVVFLASLFFAVILLPFDKQRKYVHAQAFWWSDAIIALNPFWKLNVSGLEYIDYKQAYVIVANHQSLADIIVLYKTRMQFKWVAREKIFSVPLIGWCLSLAKHIKIYRGQFSSIKRTYQVSSEWLQANMSVLFFPEGTRSKTGKLNQFKNGAFKLAIKEKKPILPVSINGTIDAIAKGSWIFTRKVTAELKVHPAIETTQFTSEDVGQLKDLVYARLAAM